MTKKDLFKIIFKLYGLYCIIDLITQIPTISFYLYSESVNEMNWLIITVPLLSLLVIFILIFKPELVIRLFKLDKGFDNSDVAASSASGNGIARTALIIIGVYLIVSSFSEFISQVVFSFRESVSGNALDSLLETFNPSPFNQRSLIVNGLNLVMGILLLTNNTAVSNWIDKINRKNAG